MRNLPQPKYKQMALYMVLIAITIIMSFSLKMCRHSTSSLVKPQSTAITTDSTRYIPVRLLR